MPPNAYARVAVWLGLIVAMATAVAVVPVPRTSRTSVAPRAAAGTVEADTPPPWQIALETMDRALAAGDISGAEMAWRHACRLAIRSRQWQALLAAGDGSLRIGDRVQMGQPYRARARAVWRDALFRARAQHSIEGVLRVADAFARLGDTDVVTQVLRIADGLAAADATGEARRRVFEVRNRLTPAAPAAGMADPILTLFPDAAVGP
jgi:hypothetical protein